MHSLSLSARLVLVVVGSAALAACSSDPAQSTPTTDAQFQAQITTTMQTSLLTDINGLLQASKDLQAAAPTHAWNTTTDAADVQSMKNAWFAARTAYEHVEGALAPIFPDVDISIDERYDGFIDGHPDDYLFDDMGVTGLHAVERILYSNQIPADVVAFESQLTGYKAAAFPATDQEAADFKNKLLTKMIADAQTFHDGWMPLNISIGEAFKGLIGLMNEQKEKVNNAAGGAEESRYSQRTMQDLRDNLAGTKNIYEIFRPWLQTKAASNGGQSGAQTDTNIEAGFTQLGSLYATVNGSALPAPPATWNADSPSAADLATPFGQLYTQIRDAVDPTKSTSIVGQMNTGAGLMGLPEFME